jgi:HEAT repeat protein
LNDPAPQVRAAAARALGVLQYREAIPQLRALFEKEQNPDLVGMFAAIALKRLGSNVADVYVSRLLTSAVPDIRLMAAEGYAGSPRGEWVAAVKALGTNPSELARVRAARLLACCEPTTARAMLFDALASPTLPLRVEAARTFEEKELGDAKVARRLLGDAFDQVRLHGAGIVLRLAATAGAPG